MLEDRGGSVRIWRRPPICWCSPPVPGRSWRPWSIPSGQRAGVQGRVDVAKVQTLGIPVTDIYAALQTFLGGLM